MSYLFWIIEGSIVLNIVQMPEKENLTFPLFAVIRLKKSKGTLDYDSVL